MRKNTPKKSSVEEIAFGLSAWPRMDPSGDLAGGIAGTIKVKSVSRDPLHELARKGARDMIAQALEEEVGEYLERYASVRDEAGHRMVVHNGQKPGRQIITGIGPGAVSQPRIDDRRVDQEGRRERFESKLLPPYLRR